MGGVLEALAHVSAGGGGSAVNPADLIPVALLVIVAALLWPRRTERSPQATPHETRRTLELKLEHRFHALHTNARRELLEHLEIAEHESGVTNVTVNPSSRPWRREVN